MVGFDAGWHIDDARPEMWGELAGHLTRTGSARFVAIEGDEDPADVGFSQELDLLWRN